MRALFVDLDVLTADGHLDPELVAIYKTMVSQLDVAVVLTAPWRFSQKIGREIRRHGIRYDDLTPFFDDHDLLTPSLEIQLWLNEHEPERYAILDDDDMIDGQLPNFFRCNGGITAQLAKDVLTHFRTGQ